MDLEQIKTQIVPLIRKHILPLGLGVAGMILFIYGLIALLGSSSPASNIIFEANSATVSASLTNIVVDVEGAVVKPGVYKLSSDARVQDVLIAAGGLSSRADRAWVSKNLNLALKLTDGAKIYIPAAGETPAQSSAVQGAQSSVNVDGLVNVNSASQSELDTLPGIGAVTAVKIISNRPYGAISELLERKIVGSKVFSQIKDKISVY